ALGVDVFARNELLHVEGEDIPVNKGIRAFMGMLRIIRKSQHLNQADVDRILGTLEGEHGEDEAEGRRAESSPERARGERMMHGHVKAMTAGQERYLAAIKDHDVVFA